MTEIRMGRYSLSVAKNTCDTERIVKYAASLTATLRVARNAGNAGSPADLDLRHRAVLALDRSTGHVGQLYRGDMHFPAPRSRAKSLWRAGRPLKRMMLLGSKFFLMPQFSYVRQNARQSVK